MAKQLFFLLLLSLATFLFSCSKAESPAAEHEEEALARTEFTDRIENFFEYSPLHVGKPSQFLIHLTDLNDGNPVEKAEVSLTIQKEGGGPSSEVKAKVGRVTGIYVAEVQLGEKGTYEISFHVKNEKLDERLALKGFEVD